MQRGRQIRVALIVALVVGLHAAALFFLLSNSKVALTRANPQSMEIVFIARAPPQPSTSSGATAQEPRRARAAPERQRSGGPSALQAMPPEEDRAIHPPIDWAAELSQTARDATADKSAQTPRDFGFPKRPAAPVKPPKFEWDYAATHRVERLEGGGILVNLNDRCVLLLFPFPFMACGIGEKPANGDLFKHMGDPDATAPTP